VEEEEEADDSGDSGSGTGTTDGDPASGNPIVGTPGNLSQGDTTTDPNDPNTVVPAATACGVGTFAFAPLTLVGVGWVKLSTRRRARRT
jgi:hypothetical protein